MVSWGPSCDWEGNIKTNKFVVTTHQKFVSRQSCDNVTAVLSTKSSMLLLSIAGAEIDR